MTGTEEQIQTRDTVEPQTGAPEARATHRQIVHRLSSAQKSSKGAPAYSRYLNRPLGRQFAAVAYRWGGTPNQVTVLSAGFTFAGIAIMATMAPSWPVAVLVTTFLVLGYALDAADGQLARLRGGGSLSGEWLDHVIDATKIPALHLAVLVAMYRFTVEFRGPELLVPIGFTLVATVLFFGMILTDQLRRQVLAPGVKPLDRGNGSAIKSLLVIPTDYGLLCLIFLTYSVPSLFFVLYALLALGSALYCAAVTVKWFFELKGLEQR